MTRAAERELVDIILIVGRIIIFASAIAFLLLVGTRSPFPSLMPITLFVLTASWLALYFAVRIWRRLRK